MRRFLQVYSAIEQVPSFTNRIRLSDKRDALGVPRVTVEWGTASSEERTYRRGLEILLDELEKLEPGIRSSAMDDIDPWPSGIVGNWHHIGTTRMHKDPKRGAVDEHCRVHGITNLFVAGSSVFPVSGSTSPTLTIVQLALRLADQIARQLI
jgi:choline dehydrogenase-like flavoprotein